MADVVELLCLFFGHAWSLAPPWTGKELTWFSPHCERCGYKPDDIEIIGEAEKPYIRPEAEA